MAVEEHSGVIIASRGGTIQEGWFSRETEDVVFGSKKESICTIGAGPCIVMAGVNLKTRRKVIGHFNDINPDINPSFEGALNRFGELGSLASSRCILLACSQTEHPELPADRQEDRDLAVNMVRSRFSELIIVQAWAPDNTVTDVGITADCKVVVCSYPRLDITYQ